MQQAPCYGVAHHSVSQILNWISAGEIAIPEIQRPFVWPAVKVRNFLDSLYRGYPVGYLIAWKNPDVRLKDGSKSSGKKVLIDGQQRVTAIMASLLGREVVTKEYDQVRIRIAFHPVEERFEVCNTVIEKDSLWIPDVSILFQHGVLLGFANDYIERNPGVDKNHVFATLMKLSGIMGNQLGFIELAGHLDIETVTEIFIRVNSAGAELSQADFAMSKIASNETYGGNVLRKAIDYFCHLAVAPEFYDQIKRNDPAFAATDYFQKMSWLKDETSDIYDPEYTDMMRVAFASRFRRGRLEDLVAMLSGRNFETKQFEEPIAEASFEKLRLGVLDFMNESNFKKFLMIIMSAGFIHASLIGSQNALNFAYILYLYLKDRGIPQADIESLVRRWFVMSILTGRYSNSPESAIDHDIRMFDERSPEEFARAVFDAELSDTFFDATLPQEMDTSATNSPYFRVFRAALVKCGDLGFLSRDITAQALIAIKSDVHHIFPRGHLKKAGLTKVQYNQIANFAIMQTEINIQIRDRPPEVYFRELVEQCAGGPKRYGGITDIEELKRNLAMHCIPEWMLDDPAPDYERFIAERRRLMARKIKAYFKKL